MLAIIGKRLIATIPVMVMVAIVVFMMLRLTPGDPAAVIAGDNANSAQIEAIRDQLGLNRPLWEQFAIWGGGLLRGDLGESYFFKAEGHRPHRPAGRADPGARDHHDHLHRPGRRAHGRDRRLQARHLDRSRGHGLFRARLFRAGVRARLSPDLRVRDPARPGAGSGLHPRSPTVFGPFSSGSFYRASRFR